MPQFPQPLQPSGMGPPRSQGALAGYVHPFDTYPEPADTTQPLTDELPTDIALGKTDYMEIVAFSDHRATARVWYQLLNCGFRIPAAAGTDAMANYASLRGPVGLNIEAITAPEIALSIIAEIVAERRNAPLPPKPAL